MDESNKTPKISKEELDKQMIRLSAATFFKGDKMLREASKSKMTKLSKKGIIRAIRFALNSNVTDKKINLRNDVETTLASGLYEMFAARTIMQAHIIKQSAESVKENNNVDKEESELVGNRNAETS